MIELIEKLAEMAEETDYKIADHIRPMDNKYVKVNNGGNEGEADD
jgi:hypothetical protein